MNKFKIIFAHLLKNAAIGTPEEYAKAVSEQSDLLKVLKDRKEHSRAIRDQSSLLKGLKDRIVPFRVAESLVEDGHLPNQRVLNFKDADDFVKKIKADIVKYRREFGKVRLIVISNYIFELHGGDELFVRYMLLSTRQGLSELGLDGTKPGPVSLDFAAPEEKKDNLAVKVESTFRGKPPLVSTKLFASHEDILNAIKGKQRQLASIYNDLKTQVINGDLIVLSFGIESKIEYHLQDKAAFEAQVLSDVRRILGG